MDSNHNSCIKTISVSERVRASLAVSPKINVLTQSPVCPQHHRELHSSPDILYLSLLPSCLQTFTWWEEDMFCPNVSQSQAREKSPNGPKTPKWSTGCGSPDSLSGTCLWFPQREDAMLHHCGDAGVDQTSLLFSPPFTLTSLWVNCPSADH